MEGSKIIYPYADDEFVKVAENEESDIMELPIENNGSIMLSTIQAQFPSAIGLKYKSSSGFMRGIRAVDNVLDPPRGGWAGTVYYVTVNDSLKRKNTDVSDSSAALKVSKTIDPRLKDILVLGLPYETTDSEFGDYFTENCGELAFHEIKYDRQSGKSRGFGFIRFKTIDGADKAINTDHHMMGRKLIVKPKKENPMKMFVGRLPQGTTKESLVNYFSEFGELIDAYIPNPFRGFGFITFASSDVGRTVLLQSHVLDGSILNIEERKENRAKDESNYGNSYYSKMKETPEDMSSQLKDMFFTFLQNHE